MSIMETAVATPKVAAIPRGGLSDVEAIADRYGWSTPMARWWMSCAASTVGSSKPEAVIAFLDKTVGGVTMIRR
ncbi:hypothetical protein [Azospirillum agricola]|uniref:hypothetical protein n=1 Tax=Azospirillum agricola TaxID=1720247 RepID=UPI000A0F1C9F|nr:hypothetical protein [Azospirillum agricola]SMH46841.1 hypothetical protein SAMN02982994_2494 [Azospirillum lipoferum]